MGNHFPDARESMTRSRFRSVAAKKMSFSVARLIACSSERGTCLNSTVLFRGSLRQCERCEGGVLIGILIGVCAAQNYNVSALGGLSSGQEVHDAEETTKRVGSLAACGVHRACWRRSGRGAEQAIRARADLHAQSWRCGAGFYAEVFRR